MPSAVETLVKILRLEQETGYKNSAVIGGLEAYAPNWVLEARQQAKTDQQHALADELRNVMLKYSDSQDRLDRQRMIRYMLGRITGRTEPDPEFVGTVTDDHPSPEADDEVSHEPALPQETAELPPNQDEDRGEDDEALPESDIITTSLEVDPVLQAAISAEASTPQVPKPHIAPREPLDLETALQTLGELEHPVETLHGIGKKRAEQLAKLGIVTINHLLFHFPLRYDDYTKMYPLHRLPADETVVAIGAVTDVTERVSRQNQPLIRVTLDDGSGKLVITFFNQPYLKRAIKPDMQILVYGKTSRYNGTMTMANPEWEPVDQKHLKRGQIVPVYPLTKGISSRVMRKLVHQVVDEWASRIPDYIPESVLARTEMVDLGWALRQLHKPENWDYLSYARERLAFDELLTLQLGVLARRREWQSVPGIQLDVDDTWLNDFAASLPYELTAAQVRVVESIREDVSRDIPMNRLLQGDVGSGKTVVAAMALGMAVKNNHQAAIMAPTSILAEQHYHSIQQILSQVPGFENIAIRLLTGSTNENDREAIYTALEAGEIDILVGTHALIQQRVNFADLALAVIDEQHRFGVDQRGALRGKGTNPHVLVMTATPIPRTLALTMFADLDLSVLDEMPPGRTPIKTRLLFVAERNRAHHFIARQLEQGRQAFVVYPLIESSDQTESMAAIDAYEDLQTSVFMDFTVGLLHGRLPASEKEAVMKAFAEGELDVLISTSVIEVGINVPNASVMLIEGANRFGLAQLHQLRGRVGRGEHESYCLLLADTDNPTAVKRLEAVEENTDGFALAELDWQLRGAGDLLGTRQAGLPPIRMESAMEPRLVELAQQESRAIFAEDPGFDLPEYALLAKRIEQLQQQNTDIS